MAIQTAASGTSLVEVLDRVLDKGIVIDAWVRVSVVGLEILAIEARVVVASVDTYLKYAEAIGTTVNVAKPRLESPKAEASLPAPMQGEAMLQPRVKRARAPMRTPRAAVTDAPG